MTPYQRMCLKNVFENFTTVTIFSKQFKKSNNNNRKELVRIFHHQFSEAPNEINNSNQTLQTKLFKESAQANTLPHFYSVKEEQ